MMEAVRDLYLPTGFLAVGRDPTKGARVPSSYRFVRVNRHHVWPSGLVVGACTVQGRSFVRFVVVDGPEPGSI